MLILVLASKHRRQCGLLLWGMSFRMPALIRRLQADQKLLDACMGGFDSVAVKAALADGADPNQERYHSTWSPRQGTRLGVKQWWGGKKDIPILENVAYANYWTTPLSCALTRAPISASIVDALLEGGANPWLPGNGVVGERRPSPMTQILGETDYRYMCDVLSSHMPQIVSCYLSTPNASKLIDWEAFEAAAHQQGASDALSFVRELRSHIDSQQLHAQTQAVAPQPSPARARL